MEARITRAAVLTAALLVSMGARHRTANFIVETPDPNLAAQIGQAAEQYRHDLAIEWLGQPMPNWSQPCPMTVNVGPNLGAGGATTFVFDHGEVFGWRMTIQGTPQRVLDSVLPHEITHMIYASHFRQPLPRWADEGGATTVENIAERAKYQRMLDQFLRTGRGIAFSRMFAMTEYPSDVMPLYAQCYSLAEYLIETGGRRQYIQFLDDGLQSKDWSAAVARHYGVRDLGQLQNTWLAWVKQGSPQLTPGNIQPAAGASPEMLAANDGTRRVPATMQASAAAPGQLAMIPAGQLVPVPESLFEGESPKGTVPFSLTQKSGQSPGTDPSGVRLASATAAQSPSGWKNTSPRQPTQSTAPQPPADQPVASSSPQQPSAAPQADPFPSAVARPQDAEQPRQVILQWSAR